MINALKHPSFLRPTSRPASPVPHQASASPSRPPSSNGLDRPSRTLNKISLGTFRRSSTGLSNSVPGTLVQDGSYLETLSLKLSEAVSKALAQPAGPVQELVGGKRPIPAGRGRALGALIASEFRATQDSPHLRRAILRSLQRPLSVLLTNLSNNLLPLISSPAFYSAPPLSAQNPNLNPTQVHALAIAGFVEELLETFDALDLGTDVDVRGDSLRSIRDGLVSLINRVVSPLVTAIHKELVPVLEALEIPNIKPGGKICNGPHPSIVALQANMPIYAKALALYTASAASQATLATFLISVVWRGLVALAHRPYTSSTPPVSLGLPLSLRRSGGGANGTITPPTTPPSSRFTIKLPPSRPPSPPQPVSVPTAIDARALYDLLNLLPRPTADKDSTRLAREAVDDAFEGLKALPPLLDAVHSMTPPKADSPHHLNELAVELEFLATELPLLIAMPVLLQAPVSGRGPIPVSVGEFIGLSELEYRNQCLPGFGRAEECATTVALRVLVALRSNSGVHPVVCRWLEMEIAEALEIPGTI